VTELEKREHPFDAYEHPNLQTKEWTNLKHTGEQFLITFQSGYGASVVRHQFSYGGTEGLWELAVTDDGNLCYDTAITDDVEGYLTEADAMALFDAIAILDRTSVAAYAKRMHLVENLAELKCHLEYAQGQVYIDLSSIKAAIVEIEREHGITYET
jgi:hypothetical protein